MADYIACPYCHSDHLRKEWPMIVTFAYNKGTGWTQLFQITNGVPIFLCTACGAEWHDEFVNHQLKRITDKKPSGVQVTKG